MQGALGEGADGGGDVLLGDDALGAADVHATLGCAHFNAICGHSG